MIKKSFALALLGSIPLMASIFLIPLVIQFVHLSHFDEAMPLLKSLMFTIPMMGMMFCFQGAWVGVHRLKFSALWNLQGAILNIIIVALMVRGLGVRAAIDAAYIATGVTIVIGLLSLRRSWNNLLEKKRVLS